MKSILICIAAYDNMGRLKPLVRQLCASTQMKFEYTVISGPYVHKNRNMCITQDMVEFPQLSLKYDDYLFMDTDADPTYDQVYQMCGYDLDIVGGLMKKNGRKDEQEYVVQVNGKPVKFGEELKGLQPVDAIHMGCTKVASDVFEELPFPWFEAGYAGPPENMHFMPEDFYLCENARKAGFNVWCDFDLKIRHHLRRGKAFEKEFKV